MCRTSFYSPLPVRRIAQLEDRLRVYEGYTTSQSRDGAAWSPPRHAEQAYEPTSMAVENDDDMTQLLRGVNYLTIETRNPEFYGGSSLNAIVNAVEADEEVEEQPTASRAEWPLNRAKLWLDNTANMKFAQVADASLPPKTVADVSTPITLYMDTLRFRFFPFILIQLFEC